MRSLAPRCWGSGTSALVGRAVLLILYKGPAFLWTERESTKSQACWATLARTKGRVSPKLRAKLEQGSASGPKPAARPNIEGKCGRPRPRPQCLFCLPPSPQESLPSPRQSNPQRLPMQVILASCFLQAGFTWSWSHSHSSRTSHQSPSCCVALGLNFPSFKKAVCETSEASSLPGLCWALGGNCLTG